jgi:hypothetical protein
MAKLYDEKDWSSHTFRKTQPSSPYNFPPGTPMSISVYSAGDLFPSERMSPVMDDAEIHGNAGNETPHHGSV